MKKNQITPALYRLFILSTITLTFLLSCKKEEPVEPGNQLSKQETENINQLLASLSTFTQAKELPEPELQTEETERNADDSSMECTTAYYKAAPGYDEMIALDPGSDVIYPGAMLKGESITTGEYIAINGGRAPVTLSISLENINGSPQTTVDDPKLSTVRSNINSLLQQGVNGATPARIVYETQEVYSEQQLNLAIGANYRDATKSISSSFDFSNSSYEYKYVIKYMQIYYSIDIDLPANNNPAAFFNTTPILESTSPVIVSSVKYGRMVIYTVESNYSKTEIQGAFSAAFTSGDGTVESDYEKVFENSSIKGIVIGGSGADAAKIVDGPKGVYEFITQGGNYSAKSPGAPLAYTLRYIKNDFPIARIVLTSEYPVRTCYQAYQRFRVEIHGVEFKYNDNEPSPYELYGSINASIYIDDDRKSKKTWSRSENNVLNIEKNKLYKIDEWFEYEVYMPDLDKDYVLLNANLYEKDVFSNDHLGNKDKKILLKDVYYANGARPEEYYTMQLQDDKGSLANIYFYVYRLY